MAKDLSFTGNDGAQVERDDSSAEARRVLNCEQVGRTYCLELDDGTFIFMDFSCG